MASLTSKQITEWQAYYALEPFGEARADLRMATLASLIANANRDPDKKREPFTIADFMPHFGEAATAPAPRQTWQQQKSILQKIFKPK